MKSPSTTARSAAGSAPTAAMFPLSMAVRCANPAQPVSIHPPAAIVPNVVEIRAARPPAGQTTPASAGAATASAIPALAQNSMKRIPSQPLACISPASGYSGVSPRIDSVAFTENVATNTIANPSIAQPATRTDAFMVFSFHRGADAPRPQETTRDSRFDRVDRSRVGPALANAEPHFQKNHGTITSARYLSVIYS